MTERVTNILSGLVSERSCIRTPFYGRRGYMSKILRYLIKKKISLSFFLYVCCSLIGFDEQCMVMPIMH